MTDNGAPTAILADDEPFMRAALRERLAQLWPELRLLRECGDGIEALQAIQRLRPQLAFLDIRMPGLTGLQVADALQGVGTRVVFVTAYDAHAVEAFEAQAVDYVLKPVELPRLAKTVARLREALTSSPTSPGDDWLQVHARRGGGLRRADPSVTEGAAGAAGPGALHAGPPQRGGQPPPCARRAPCERIAGAGDQGAA
jgi:CheY-like chemotaxis protein